MSVAIIGQAKVRRIREPQALEKLEPAPEVIYVDKRLNSESFAEHCLPHLDTLRAFAQRLALGRRWDADDIVQEALVKALRRWPHFDMPDVEDPAPWVRSWLCKIVMHKFVEGYRRKRRQREHLATRLDEVVENLHGDAEMGPRGRSSKVRVTSRSRVDGGVSDEVEIALRELDADSRDLVERVDFHGESYAGAATRLGVPIGTIMSRLFRARRVLGAALQGYARREYSIGR